MIFGLPRALLLLALLWISTPAPAQSPVIQAALGGWPGIGVQLGYVQPRSIYTLEVMSYLDVLPWRDESPLYVSAGVGAALRPLGVLRVIGRTDYGYDLDLGVRFGPGLFFTEDATRAEKNRQFSLFLDPFLRFTHHSVRQGHFLVELGPQRPALRFGFWLSVQ